ncbi:MAG: glycoside hydrolase family 3 protein [Firmicutes bacterium]|nr:glycoside hydrolase family 3 protein [Bacillota bacterium]
MAPSDWESLSLREKIGQTMLIKVTPELVHYSEDELAAFLTFFPVGGIFLCREGLEDAAGDRERVAGFITRCRRVTKTPLLFAADMENGCHSLAEDVPPLPSLMALGATGDPELAYAYGRSIALGARSLGIDLALSPVADLNLNPLNPITNIRSIGDDPEAAVKLLTALVRGMQEEGLAATAKHFPGDGVDYRDQHLVTTANSLSWEDWQRKHGAVFRALIEAEVETVMTGHISLPARQTPTKEGRYLPATLSPELTTGLLKGEMGFRGVVISDALDMGGFLKWYGRERGEIECFLAGTDMLLWPGLGYFDAMEQAISEGKVPRERLEEALARIRRLKERLGLFGAGREAKELTEGEREYIEETAAEVAQRSLTLVCDRKGFLPLHRCKGRKALLIVVSAEEGALAEMSVFKEELAARGLVVEARWNIRPAELETVHGGYDLIFYALAGRPHAPRGPLSYSGPAADSIWAALSYGAEKSIVVSFGSPYYYGEYFEPAEVYINAYSAAPATQKAVARAIFGEIGFPGRSPVKIGLEKGF